MPELLTTDTYLPQTKRQQYELLRSQLEIERSTFLSHWRELGDYILPRRPRFNTTETNRGDRRSKYIIDSTATLAARTLRSGMMGGITSPARPWKKLTVPDPDLAEFGAVKEWLDIVNRRMDTVFLKSNLYNMLPILYQDIGVFGTGCLFIEEDFEDVIRAYSFPIGSYMIANDEKLKVRVFIREFRMTVRQLVGKFGKRDANGKIDWSNFSVAVKNMWEGAKYEAWIDVCHVVTQNPNFDPNRANAKFKRYSSCYYEKGYSSQASQTTYLDSADEDRYLRESGYDFFPALCARWEVTGEDAYGTSCPGMEALGDTKQLQTVEKRTLQAVEKMINPPMVGPPSLRSQKASILPGDITYAMENTDSKFRPAHETRYSIQEAEMKQDQVRARIRRCFYEDLWLMFSTTDRREITAREVDERHEEKLVTLGPVLEQLNQDVLDPLIDISFAHMLKQGYIPPPPDEIQGMPLKVEYVSIMAQAQKILGVSSIERFASFAGTLVKVTEDISVVDKVNVDQMIDEYGDALGIPVKIIRTDEDVQSLRETRAKQQQEAQQQEALAQIPKGAKDLASADMSGDNALTRIVNVAKAGQIAPQ